MLVGWRCVRATPKAGPPNPSYLLPRNAAADERAYARARARSPHTRTRTRASTFGHIVQSESSQAQLVRLGPARRSLQRIRPPGRDRRVRHEQAHEMSDSSMSQSRLVTSSPCQSPSCHCPSLAWSRPHPGLDRSRLTRLGCPFTSAASHVRVLSCHVPFLARSRHVSWRLVLSVLHLMIPSSWDAGVIRPSDDPEQPVTVAVTRNARHRLVTARVSSSHGGCSCMVLEATASESRNPRPSSFGLEGTRMLAAQITSSRV